MSTDPQTGLCKATLRVLHAEDSDDCAFLVKRALKKAGFGQEPIRVRDGEEAISHLSAPGDGKGPHVILLDLHMPKKDGFDVLDWIRRQPHYRDVLVVMLTASERPEDIERAQNLGASNFLPKEGTYRKVVALLETLAGGAAPSGEPPAGKSRGTSKLSRTRGLPPGSRKAA